VTLQSEIARDVSQELKVRLSGDDRQRLAKNYTSNAEAYRLYLQGDTFGTSGPRRTSRKASNILNQAIALDPDFALGYTGIADSYSALSFNTFNPIRPADLWPKVKEAALRALEIDNELPRHTRRSGL
jgi:serine/threonine-protein kinase